MRKSFKQRTFQLWRQAIFLCMVFAAHLQSNNAIRPYNKYGDEYNPFKMMEINKAYPDNLQIRNGVGFHFAYSFQPVKYELYLFRRIDINHIATGIQVLKRSANIIKEHCKSIKPSFDDDFEDYESEGGTVKRFKNNFFLAESAYVEKDEAERLCKQRGAFLPEIYHYHELQEINKLMNENSSAKKLTQVHHGLYHDVAMGVKRFIVTGLPAHEGYLKKVSSWHPGGRTIGPIYEYYRDYRAEWYLTDADHYLQHINGNHQGALITARCKGDTYCSEDQAKSRLSGASVICQRVINPPSGSRLRPFYRGNELNNLNHTAVMTEPRQQLIDMATENFRYCKATASSTLTAAQTLETRLRNTLDHVNIRLGDLDVTEEAESLVTSWVNYLAQRNDGLPKHPNQGKHGAASSKDPSSTPAPAGKSRPRRWIGLAMSGLTVASSGITRLIKYHYIDKHQQAEIGKLNNMAKKQSLRLDNLELQASQFESVMTEVVNKISSLVAITGTVLIYAARLAELLAYDETLDQAITNLNYAISRLEAIAHSSLEGKTHMFALNEEQMEKVKNVVARNTAGLLKENLGDMKSGFMVDPVDPRYLILIINTPAVSREAYVATELVPIHFFHDGHKYKHSLKSQYYAMDKRAKTFYEMEEKDFIQCRVGRCIQKNLTKRINDHPCEFPLKASEKELAKCKIEQLPDLEPFFKLQHPDGVFYSVAEPLTSTLSCPNNDWITDLEPNEELVRHGTIQIPQGCQLEIKKPGTIELTIPGPPVFKMIDIGEIDFSVTPAATNTGMDIGQGYGHERLYNVGEDRVDNLEIYAQEINLGVQRLGHRLNLWVWIAIALASILFGLILALAIWIRFHWKAIMAIRARLPSVFRFPPPDSHSDSEEEHEWPEAPPHIMALAPPHQAELPTGTRPKVMEAAKRSSRSQEADPESSSPQPGASQTVTTGKTQEEVIVSAISKAQFSGQSSLLSGQEKKQETMQNAQSQLSPLSTFKDKTKKPQVKPKPTNYATVSKLHSRKGNVVVTPIRPPVVQLKRAQSEMKKGQDATVATNL